MVGVLSAQAQTNAPKLYTNYVTADPNFRRANGQLYNVQKSVLWENIRGEFFAKENGIVIVTTFVEKSYSTGGGGLTANQRIGGYAGPSVGASSVKYRDFGNRIAVTNCLDRNISEGATLSTVAMKSGTADYGGTTLELWDCGTPNIIQIVSTNAPSSRTPPAKVTLPTVKTNDAVRKRSGEARR